MKHYIVKDTLEAYLTIGGENYFYGLTTEGSIARMMSQEDIQAGLGSKIVGVISQDEGFEISITTGVYYAETIELQMSAKLADVTDIEIMDVTEDDAGLITATPVTVAGEAMELTAGALPKNAKLQLRTLAYDSETNEVVAEIFYIFDRVSPAGEFTHDFGMGTNNVQELTFKALIPKGKSTYGRYVIVPVTKQGEYTPVVGG